MKTNDLRWTSATFDRLFSRLYVGNSLCGFRKQLRTYKYGHMHVFHANHTSETRRQRCFLAVARPMFLVNSHADNARSQFTVAYGTVIECRWTYFLLLLCICIHTDVVKNINNRTALELVRQRQKPAGSRSRKQARPHSSVHLRLLSSAQQSWHVDQPGAAVHWVALWDSRAYNIRHVRTGQRVVINFVIDYCFLDILKSHFKVMLS